MTSTDGGSLVRVHNFSVSLDGFGVGEGRIDEDLDELAVGDHRAQHFALGA